MVVKDAFRQSIGKVSGKVGCVVWTGAGFVADCRDSTVGVSARDVVSEVHVNIVGG